jgi:predicted SAM-dependent methyltransferase
MSIKLNVGASPIWVKEGWHTLDHKLKKTSKTAIAGNAVNIDLPDESCEIVFCSHVFEHIPHTQLPIVLSEINRVLCVGGVLRVLTPDLAVIAKAYVAKDDDFFRKAKKEDETIRTDLGFGGMFMNFVVSPGQDTALFNRDLNQFVAGYAHLYSYDYEMLATLLDHVGYSPKQAKFGESDIEELREPLHVIGQEPIWQNLNQDFYSKNGLIHKMTNGKYEINFKTTGFDRNPLTSLVIEATKESFVNKETANEIFNNSLLNYNRYSLSLLTSQEFTTRLDKLKIPYS